jgi:hypothetical protein
MPSFWFNGIDKHTTFTFTRASEYYQCREVSNINLLINPSNEEPNTYSPESLKKIKLKEKSDLIHAELIKNRDEIKDYKNINDYLLNLLKFAYHNLNTGKDLIIHLTTIENETMHILNDLIQQNIFIDYQIMNTNKVSLVDVNFIGYFVYLSNYSGKKYKKSKNLKEIKIDDIKDIVQQREKIVDAKFAQIYEMILKLKTKEEAIEFVKNNIIEMCHNIGIYIGSKYLLQRKYKHWNHIFSDYKLLNICYYIDNKDDSFKKYIHKNHHNYNEYTYLDDSHDLHKINIIYVNLINTYSKIDIIHNFINLWKTLKTGILIFDNIHLDDIIEDDVYMDTYHIFMNIIQNNYKLLMNEYQCVILQKK